MFTPLNLRYTSDHLWLRDIGRQEAYAGITDYGQRELGRIDFIEIDHDEKKKKGELFGVIYGANKSIDLIMPFPGQVLIINPDIELSPQGLNTDPYYHWIVLLTASVRIADIMANCFDAKEYQDIINGSKINSK
jgi:glycine cleavage system H protein